MKPKICDDPGKGWTEAVVGSPKQRWRLVGDDVGDDDGAHAWHWTPSGGYAQCLASPALPWW